MEEAPVGFLPTAERRLVAEWLAVPHEKRSFSDWWDTRDAMERAFTHFWDQFRPGIECESVAVLTTDRITLADIERYQRFDADWVSFEDDFRA